MIIYMFIKCFVGLGEGLLDLKNVILITFFQNCAFQNE